MLALALAVASTAWAGQHHGRLVLEDFERFGWGGDWVTLHCSERADPRLKPESGEVHGGAQACRLDVPPGESLTVLTHTGTRFTDAGGKPPLPLPGRPERIGLWVRGRKSGHQLSLRLLDARRTTADVSLGYVDFEGWRLLEGQVPQLTPPIGLRGLTVRGGRGPLIVDDVTVTTRADAPLHVAIEPAYHGAEATDDERTQFRVVVQSLAGEPVSGRGRVAAFGPTAGDEPTDWRSFSFEASPETPAEAKVRLRLGAGVHRVVASAGEAEASRRIVVFPTREQGISPSPRHAIRLFGERRDDLWVYESALSPAIVIESRRPTLTLFRALEAVGLSTPRDSLMRIRRRATRTGTRRELIEPWLLVWFGASPQWYSVTFGDGTPCPTFDVPFLVVLEYRPEDLDLDEHGLRLSFRRRAGRVALMPLFGVRRLRPTETARWRGHDDGVRLAVEQCRWWARALRALPIGVEESWKVDPAADEVTFRLRYSYLESRGDWKERPLRVAPAPPLLALAARAGFPARFVPELVPTRCSTAVGPYMAAPGTDELTITMRGMLRHVRRALADAPGDVALADLGLSAQRRELSADVPKMPFWADQLGDRGGLVCESVLRSLLWEDNARYALGDGGLVRALDGLAWQTQGEQAAAALAADHLRGCWYAALHARRHELLRPRWRHIESLRATLRPGPDWATLGLGASDLPFDAHLNAELYFARLAAALGHDEAAVDACGRLVRLFAAGHALAGAAPDYAKRHAPWPTLVGRRDGAAPFGRFLGGSLGLAPGPRPFVSSPSDGGYSFAARHLGKYFAERFQGGPLHYYGRTPQEWARREFRDVPLPTATRRFYTPRLEAGAYGGNYVYDVQPGTDGWPTVSWASHRSPGGGPLVFGTCGTDLNTRGTLHRTRVVSPHLRLTAYRASEAPPPPTTPSSPKPTPPEELRGAADADTPARNRR